ncbi:ferric reductase [Deinococcus detaillensis]|uniref:Ferric reductase n=1 Tax=Deinococcus detaillensis TaxID=2592048 RepID=A0A553UI77_9DEIO|nr:ferric reductase-like transmembrane domain-containing protein [Deinococcus detaillensis]TSA79928.1 ferric reductase [Deinococcus detaillensis]
MTKPNVQGAREFSLGTPSAQTRSPLPAATLSNAVSANRWNALLALALGTLLLGSFVLSALHLTPGPLAWSLLRATGIVAYLALAVTVTFGALLGSRSAPAWLARAQQYGWHGLLSGFALIMGGAHGLFLMVDGKYAQPLRGVLLPGASSFAPLAVGLGTLGLYGLALVYLSTRWRKRLSLKVWRALHLAAYPAFGMLTLHGVLTGSDHLGVLYGTALTCALFTFGLRLTEEVSRRGGPPVPGRR